MRRSTRRGFLKQTAVATGVLALGGPAARGAAASPEKGEELVHNHDEPGATVGVRPYEMDWAGRFEPAHPQLVDFEDLTGWRLRPFEGASVSAYRSREELLFGEHTAKVVYTGESEQSGFILEPPEPIGIPQPFDAANIWMRGNNWGWMNPPKTARVEVFLLLTDADGRLCRLRMGVNNFDYWFLFHASLKAADGKPRYETVGEPGDTHPGYPAFFAGIEVRGCWNTEPARLYFDALSFYEQYAEPLTFKPIPGDLAWPTTAATILPTVKENSGPPPAFDYAPGDGTLGDLTVTIDGRTFQPCVKGGIRFEVNGRLVLAEHPEFKPMFQGERAEGSRRLFDWELSIDGIAMRYTYGVEVIGKSCVIDVTADGVRGVQFDIGLETGLPGAKTVKIPYLTYSWDGWPRLVCGEGTSGPIFLLSLMDPFNSDASELFGPADLTAPEALGYTGGARYKPTTAGARNPVRERLFVNVSADVQEVLPNIPNPDCDTAEIARECLCNNLGDAGYPFPYETLRKYKAHGIDKYIANHHENLWRRGGESFTIREIPAPEIGEQELVEYCAFVRSLGYRLGLYQNYTDLAPVNAAWDDDLVCQDPDGSWRLAWPRNYALKPLRGAELQAEFGPRVNKRYGTTASCIDVHTALAPWERTDYDARTPGAGKFRTQFDAYARILINEGRIHNGPAISEGNYHWLYAGIADGNYATILPFGSGHETPPLVDFDLFKMHTKMTDLGMGSPFCFYGYEGEWNTGVPRTARSFDRFVVATIAYGHIGYLAEPWGFDGMLKCYYLLQALQQRYVSVPVGEIRYFDGKNLVDTSAAIATDAYLRGQVCVHYTNDLSVWCNLSQEHDWALEVDGRAFLLPPDSFLAHRPGDILAYSAVLDGKRHELVSCRDYLYLDSRDSKVSTYVISAEGAVAVKPDGPGAWWVIPALEAGEVAISLDWLGATPESRFEAAAYNEAGEESGAGVVSVGDSNVMLNTLNVEGVVKYRLLRS